MAKIMRPPQGRCSGLARGVSMGMRWEKTVTQCRPATAMLGELATDVPGESPECTRQNRISWCRSQDRMSITPDNDRWFRDEVGAHRDALHAWLKGRFPGISDVDNLIQETMTRVWQTRATSGVSSPRSMLYTTAHNLAIDQLRRQKIVSIQSLTEFADLPVYEESPSPADATLHRQELELLTQALQSLPGKCRQVLTLRKIYGLSQKEIAAQLGISEHTVEAQVTNGMKRCAAFFARLGLP